MWDTLNPENFETNVDVDVDVETNVESENFVDLKQQEEPWFRSLINALKKYKNGLFGGESDSTTNIKKQRMLDYTVPPNYKFVFAKYVDGFYRPASIMGRSKKLHLFVVLFYHNRKCCYVKRKDILVKHGNLLDKKVCFCYDGEKRKGKVYGNNSPANDGFPSIFFVKKKDEWFRVNFKSIFLTKKQVNKIYFIDPRRRKSSSSLRSLRKCKSDAME